MRPPTTTSFGIHDFSVFLLTGILLNHTPGPDTFYILGRSMAQGRGAGHAREAGVTELCLSSSLTAVPFYERFGFIAGEPMIHRLGDGTGIPCIPMRRVGL